MRRLATFGRFWYDFIVGDDWRLAAGVVLTLAVTAALSKTAAPAWAVMPVGIVAILTGSLWSAGRRRPS